MSEGGEEESSPRDSEKGEMLAQFKRLYESDFGPI